MNSIPPVTKNLLIINVLCFFASLAFASHGIELEEMFGLHFFLASNFRPWQLFTYMFMHASWQHLFFNMFALWMFGTTLENFWGTKRFLVYYLLCGIGAGLISMFIPQTHTVGASAAVYGLLLAFGMTFPNEYIYLYFLMPIKAKWFVTGYALIELFEGVFFTYDGIAHFAHLAGMLIGLLLILWWRRHPFSRF